MKFEWNRAKTTANIHKHAVSLEEAATVFAVLLSHAFPDIDHSDDENRFLLIGVSHAGRILVVSHTGRGDAVGISRYINILQN